MHLQQYLHENNYHYHALKYWRNKGKYTWSDLVFSLKVKTCLMINLNPIQYWMNGLEQKTSKRNFNFRLKFRYPIVTLNYNAWVVFKTNRSLCFCVQRLENWIVIWRRRSCSTLTECTFLDVSAYSKIRIILIVLKSFFIKPI